MTNYALITGASSGLGVDFADLLGGRGYHLILVARRLPRLQEIRRTLAARYSIDVVIIGMDLAKADAGKALFEDVQQRGLHVEVLINNAGFGIYGLFKDIDWYQERDMMQLDVISLMSLTKHFVPDMVRQGRGFILQVASIGAYQPCPSYASYAAAKSFVLNFGEALNYELRPDGVHVCVLSPGVTATEFLKVSGQQPTLYQRLAVMASRPVAQAGLRALFKGKASVVPGLFNKLTVFSNRLLPRPLALIIAYMSMKQPHTRLETP